MAKENMICPFSKDLCRECPLYKGRHYYLCYYRSYGGHLESSEKRIDQGLTKSSKKSIEDFDIPPVLEPSATWLVFNEIIEIDQKRGEK